MLLMILLPSLQQRLSGNKSMQTHAYGMEIAYQQACLAGEQGEVPVGACFVREGQCLARAYNQPIGQKDPTAHAEILVLRDVATKLQNYRIGSGWLYVTLEPCLMCLSAAMHARITGIVFGTSDTKVGVFSKGYTEHIMSNHHLSWLGPIDAQRCGGLLQNFFAERRS